MKCVNPECQVPDCSSTKALVTNHTRQCRAGDACTYPRCALSKRLMRHHRECPDQACPICLPLRRRLAAAKMGAVAGQVPQHAQNRPQAAEAQEGGRKKDDDDDYDAKRRRALQNGQQKAGRRLAPAQETVEIVPAAELDILESGFCVSVLFVNSRRGLAGIPAEGDWRPGVVMRAYTVPHEREIVYDVMMAETGVEEKAVQHSAAGWCATCCLCDKRAFRPPPMFCEKCAPPPSSQAIHQRWSYWEESGEEGGIKLCKRCHADIRASHHPDRLLADLAHRPTGTSTSSSRRRRRTAPSLSTTGCSATSATRGSTGRARCTRARTRPTTCSSSARAAAPGARQGAAEGALHPDVGHAQDGRALLAAAEGAPRGAQVAPRHVRARHGARRLEHRDDDQVRAGAPGRVGDAASGQGGGKPAPRRCKEFPYRSKCVLAFQKVHASTAHEVCFFAMYVQEYGSDCPEPNTNRVYISYLDSVRYFQSSARGPAHDRLPLHADRVPRVRARAGFTHAHIWVSPPKQGDDYIFYAHPESMVAKRMGLLKLQGVVREDARRGEEPRRRRSTTRTCRRSTRTSSRSTTSRCSRATTGRCRSIVNKIIDQEEEARRSRRRRSRARRRRRSAPLEEEQKRIAEEEARRAKQLEEQKKAAAERAAAAAARRAARRRGDGVAARTRRSGCRRSGSSRRRSRRRRGRPRRTARRAARRTPRSRRSSC